MITNIKKCAVIGTGVIGGLLAAVFRTTTCSPISR